MAIAAHFEALGALVCLKTILNLAQVLVFAAKIEVCNGEERYTIFELIFHFHEGNGRCRWLLMEPIAVREVEPSLDTLCLLDLCFKF